MRSRWTALVVAAVGAVALLGVVDAVRGDGTAGPEDGAETETTAPEPAPAPLTTSGRLEEEGVGGLLYVAERDRGECRVVVYGLPTLSRSALPPVPTCRIRISPTGLLASGPACRTGREGRVTAQTGAGLRRLRGCAPAWRPDGRLTFVRPGGDVVELVEPCASVRPCLRVAAPRSAFPGRPVEIAWFDRERLVAVVEEGGRSSLAIVERGRLAEARILPDRPRPYLRVALGRALLAPGPGSPGGVRAFDPTGRPIPGGLPRNLADGRAYTVSADGDWVASTAGGRLFVYPAGAEPPFQAIELDIQAADLGWL